ncbi:MAG: hypothetical protein IPP82_08400 [Xanthomonadales bacterium]|nr:hypothetical protein [Xanthomonadales bacterium]
MKQPVYPHYKPSGVEWLGDVPAHWTAQGVKFLLLDSTGKMLQPEPSSPSDEENSLFEISTRPVGTCSSCGLAYHVDEQKGAMAVCRYGR